MSHTTYSEMMTETAKNWHIRSIDIAYRHSGVEVPVSGDKLATIRAPYRNSFYTERQRPIEDRERAAEAGMLWEGQL